MRELDNSRTAATTETLAIGTVLCSPYWYALGLSTASRSEAAPAKRFPESPEQKQKYITDRHYNDDDPYNTVR
jgi:hypothetical protein